VVPALAADRVAKALKGLDPVSRALLDLSLRRGIPDDEIAKIVGTEPDLLVARRDEVLGELVESLGLERSPDELTRVREALKQIDWRSARSEAKPGGPPGQAERMGEPERAKPTSDHAIGPGHGDGRSRWVLLGAMVLSFLLGMRGRGRS
jgi:hypothetical protein